MWSGLSTQFLAFRQLPSALMIRCRILPSIPTSTRYLSASPKTVTTAAIHNQGVGTGRNRGAEFMHCSVVRCLLLATACLAVAYSDHLLIVVTEGSCIALIAELMLCVVYMGNDCKACCVTCRPHKSHSPVAHLPGAPPSHGFPATPS